MSLFYPVIHYDKNFQIGKFVIMLFCILHAIHKQMSQIRCND